MKLNMIIFFIHTDSFTILLWFVQFLKLELLQKQETVVAVEQVRKTRGGNNKSGFKHSKINSWMQIINCSTPY